MPEPGNTIPDAAQTLQIHPPRASHLSPVTHRLRGWQLPGPWRAQQEIGGDNRSNAPLGRSFPPGFWAVGSDGGEAEVITSDKDGSFDEAGALLGGAVQGG